ncbi:hypothetical protein FRB99_000963 [Tulasnella sp. 403]|nr:hypothetical protein FRB99_000963 [Tulasnella sp. 403]
MATLPELPAYSPRSSIPNGSAALGQLQRLIAPAATSVITLSPPPDYTPSPNGFTVRTSGGAASSSSSSEPRPVFSIGKKQTPALITPGNIKSHLVILRTFYNLREEVLSRARKFDSVPTQSRDRVVGGNPSPEEAWHLYLVRAVWRFELWLSKVLGSPRRSGQSQETWWNPKDLPPLDVILVWHAYLLHPRTYYEDGIRYNSTLLRRGSFPLHEVARMFESDDHHVPGSQAQERAYRWESCTGQPWVLSTSVNDDDPALATIQIRCPSCQEPLAANWRDETGAGWAQQGFRTTCSNCGMVVNKEAMGVAKFCDDLYKVAQSPGGRTLATMHLDEATGRPSISSAQLFNRNLLDGVKKSAFVPSPRAYAGNVLKWSMEEVTKRARIGFQTKLVLKKHQGTALRESPPEGLQRLLAAYTIPGPYSIDLVGAIKRHMRFVDKMVEFGWTEYGRFGNDSDESVAPLRRAVAQYHAFLDVMSYNHDEFMVPTLNIDLAWHTHQLLWVEYRESTTRFLGTVVDHDDAVEQENLASAFEKTSRLWTNRFNVPYTICGCPVPCNIKSPTKSARYSRLFGWKGKAKATPTSPPPTPTITNTRPDLLSHLKADAYETHPSDHAQVVLTNYPSVTPLQAAREKASRKLLATDEEAVEGGSANEWQHLVVELRKGREHVCAFGSETCDIVDGNSLSPSNAVVDLKTALAGRIFEQGDDGYDLSRWASNTCKPAKYVVFAEDEQDISRAILYAKSENLPIAVRGGGHGTSGASSTTGLVIDLRKLNQVRVDVDDKLVYVQGGAKVQDVENATIKHGLAAPMGAVGVAGFATQGGVGLSTGEYGLAIDNIVSATVVVASGDVVKASEMENSDLFWAIRGAGPNFGVIVELCLKLHEQDPMLYICNYIFLPPHLPALVPAINEWLETQSPKDSIQLLFTPDPQGHPCILFNGMSRGGKDAGEQSFRKFSELRSAHATQEMIPYQVFCTLPDPFIKTEGRRLTQGSYIDQFDLETLQNVCNAWVALLPTAPASHLIYELFYNEKVAQVPVEATAYGHRHSRATAMMCVAWKDPSFDSQAKDALLNLKSIVSSSSSPAVQQDIGYPNYADIYASQNDTDEYAKQIFGPNYERLKVVKAKWDPEGVWNFWLRDIVTQTGETLPKTALCLGLGRPTVSVDSRYQLLLFMEVLKDFYIPRNSVEIFDPTFDPDDIKELESIGFTVHQENKKGQYTFNDLTLVYMPHTPKRLYEWILRANWMPHQLPNIILLGNDLEQYYESMPRREREEMWPCIARIMRVLQSYPLPPQMSASAPFSALSFQMVDLDKAEAPPVPLENETPPPGKQRQKEKRLESVPLLNPTDDAFWSLPPVLLDDDPEVL